MLAVVMEVRGDGSWWGSASLVRGVGRERVPLGDAGGGGRECCLFWAPAVVWPAPLLSWLGYAGECGCGL